MPAPLELPQSCPCQAASGSRKETPRLRGWGSKVATGEGPVGNRGAAPTPPRSCRATRKRPSRSSPKHKPLLLRACPAPTPSCSNRQGRWLEEPRPQSCPFRPGGGDSCQPPSRPFPPVLLQRCPLSHSHIRSRLPAAGAWGTLTCSGRRSAAGDPGCSPRVPTCYILQGKREGDTA